MDGICTLANDRVYDQVVALINSIEAVLGPDYPICIYPYDDSTSQLQEFVATRPQVEIYSDRESIERWEQFARDAWDTHPTAFQKWSQHGIEGHYRLGTYRRYCGFDGPFDRFLYMDADTLLFQDITPVLQRLDEYDCVVYDFQYKDISHIYDTNSSKLTQVFPQERIDKEIFCSGFFASKKGLFPAEKREKLIEDLKNGDAEILYPMAPNQSLLNYMMMKSKASICNLSLALPSNWKTGNAVTSRHFEWKDNTLYDRGKPLTYLHYIGISSQVFQKVCAGKNLWFPYREAFLHYRYLHEPENRPRFFGKPTPYNAPPSIMKRTLRKLGLTKK
jgi:lipopolysaccharide biosynthesis glycosyltransferase